MNNQSDKIVSADIVDIVSLQGTSNRKRNAVLRGKEGESESAVLLSIRQCLKHRATIGLVDYEVICQQYSVELTDQLMMSLRRLLHEEFGHLRVHRYRQALTISHHCLETLIGGLLRVQYHCRQIELPARINTDSTEILVPAVIWGVGESVVEAEHQRMSRRFSGRS